MKTKRILYWLLVVVVLATLNFYSPTFLHIESNVYKLLSYSSVLVFAFVACSRARRIKRRGLYSSDSSLDIAVWLLFVCQLLSVLNAYLYRGQEVLTGFVAMLQGAMFIFFIFLRKADLGLRQVEQIVKWFAVSFIILSLLNRISGMPLFGDADDEITRGAVRYRLQGVYWVLLFLFLKINQYAQCKRKVDLGWILVCYVAILFTLTRQVIAVSLVIGILIYLQRVSWIKKIIFTGCICAVLSYSISNIGVVKALVEQTMEDKENQEQYDNIRIVAFNYFAFEYPRNASEVLFGCGIPAFGKSKYGTDFQKTTYRLRVYREDVGWVGFYFNFGIVAVILLLYIMCKALSFKIPPQYSYLKYFIVAVMLLSVASAPIQINYEILVLVFVLYMVIAANKMHLIQTDIRS